MIDPTGAFAAGTVKLPPSPSGGDRCIIAASKGIMALTVQDSSGSAANVVNSPGCIGVGGRLEFMYSSGSGKWICILGEPGRPFMQPLIADFTWQNQGTGTAAAVTANPFAMSAVVPADASVQVRLLEQAAPSPPYSVVLVWKPGQQEVSGSGGNDISICLRNSTNGRAFTFGSYFAPSGATFNRGAISRRWASLTSLNTNVNVVNDAMSVCALRLDVTSTNIAMYDGWDGWNWRPGAQFNETISTYVTASGGGSIDKIGFSFQPSNAWGTYHITSFGVFKA
jgi:hypothetical protein